MQNAEWFVDWFNSPYYHLLYNHRNHSEASLFIDNLCQNLQLTAKDRIWDLACGKGRHSLALNKKGFDVTGTDLSENSIHEAQANENNRLHFFIHDMRLPFKKDYFQAVFNLFTSIGYFQERKDNFLVFKNIALAMQSNAVFVVDFFNAKKVIASIKPYYKELRGDTCFEIEKKIENNAIHKRISFSIENKNYYFEERVSLLTKNDFLEFADAAGLQLSSAFGNYQLQDFDEDNSDRLILIFKK